MDIQNCTPALGQPIREKNNGKHRDDRSKRNTSESNRVCFNKLQTSTKINTMQRTID